MRKEYILFAKLTVESIGICIRGKKLKGKWNAKHKYHGL